MYSTLKINDHTNVVAARTVSPESPLSWDPAVDMAAGYGIATLTRSKRMMKVQPTMEWQRELVEKVSTEGVEAEDAIESLRSSGAVLPGYIGLRSWKGSSQDLWMDVVISGPDRELAEEYYRVWSSWARGDVYDLSLNRKCPVTGEWFTDSLEERLTEAVYLNPGTLEEFEDTILAAAETNFDTKLEPVSPRGKEILRRRELRDLISEEKVKLAHLADADVMEVANRIFALCDQLSREPVDN